MGGDCDADRGSHMSAKIKHLAPISDEPQASHCGAKWTEELKAIVNALIDLATRVLESNGAQLVLNEVVTAEELSARLKISVSTIEEFARKGKLKGAFRVGKHWRFDVDVLRTSLSIDENDES